MSRDTVDTPDGSGPLGVSGGVAAAAAASSARPPGGGENTGSGGTSDGSGSDPRGSRGMGPANKKKGRGVFLGIIVSSCKGTYFL